MKPAAVVVSNVSFGEMGKINDRRFISVCLARLYRARGNGNRVFLFFYYVLSRLLVSAGFELREGFTSVIIFRGELGSLNPGFIIVDGLRRRYIKLVLCTSILARARRRKSVINSCYSLFHFSLFPSDPA